MPDIKSMSRRLDRVKAAANPDQVHVVFCDESGDYELPDEVGPDSDDLVIIVPRIGGNKPTAPPAA